MKQLQKKILSFLLGAAVFVCALSFTACDKTYTVTLAEGETKQVVTVKDGEEYTAADSVKAGYEFSGWYDEDGVKVTFPIAVTRNMTLTAKFTYGTLAENLVSALKNYLNSETFEKSVANAKTAAAWLPLSYLRYVEGEFYTETNADLFNRYLGWITDLVDGGKIVEYKWSMSRQKEQGWYGILDYLYTFSVAYNQYREYLHGKSMTDDSFDLYLSMIKAYMEKTDTWCSHNSDKYDINGEEVSQSNLYYTGYNLFNNFSVSRYKSFGQEKMIALMAAIKTATGSDRGHSDFLAEFAKAEGKLDEMEAEEDRIAPDLEKIDTEIDRLTEERNRINAQMKDTEDESEKAKLKERYDSLTSQRTEAIARRTELKSDLTAMQNAFSSWGKGLLQEFKNCLPVTQVAFGMSASGYIAIINSMLDLGASIPYTDNGFMNYYEKDEEGNFVKEGGTPNWVGPTSRPVAASLYRDRDGYDVNFEKCRQGYFPFSDGWNQPLDEMINLDRLGKYYNHTLGTSANVTPQWGLLTGYMHGIDMENYEVYEKVEGEPSVYNIISLWRDNLKTDDDGKYVISGNIDMAVAIAYLAHINGVEAPSPLGAYDPAAKVVRL